MWTEALSGKSWKAYLNFLISLYEKNRRKSKLFCKPYVLYLDSVSYCNLQCPFCPTGTKTSDRKTGKLPFNNFMHIMDHLGPYLFELKFYNWGEPLLNNDLPQMIRYAKKYHMPVTVSTHLSIPISEQKAEEIVSSGLDFLICSIDGASQESYQKYRVGGNYGLAIKNIELLNRFKKEENSKTPQIIWQFLVFRHNEHELEKARKKAIELDVSIDFQKPYVGGLNPEEWTSTLPQFSANVYYSNHKTAETKFSNDDNLSNLLNDDKKPCSWLWSAIAISPVGSVSPCCIVVDEKDDFGLIKESVNSIWNNQNYKNARQFFGNGVKIGNVICHKCPAPEIQQNIRKHDEMIFTHLFNKLPPFLKFILKVYLKRADEPLYLKLFNLHNGETKNLA